MVVGPDPSFDREAYEDRVVRPLRGRPGALPASRSAMYAVEQGMAAQQIAGRLAAVRAFWTDLRDRGGYLGTVGEALLAADDALVAEAGGRMLDPGWWVEEDGAPEVVERVEPPAAPVLSASVRDVVVAPSGAAVRVTWTRVEAGAVHHVVRAPGRVPSGLDDGELVTSTEAGEATDPVPPVGHPVGYAVVAAVPGGRPAAGVGGLVTVVPPVLDVVVTGEQGAVGVTWSRHPAVDSVAVRRRAAGGAVAVPAHRDGFRDAAPEGVEHEYVIVARYGTLEAEPVVVRGATRPEPVPVTDLAAGAVPLDRGAGIKAGWGQAVGAEVEIRRSPGPCPWPFGAVVDDAEVAAFGEPLDGVRTVRGERVALVADVLPGPSYLTAFTRCSTGRLRGTDVRVDVVLPVTGLRARRQGAEEVLLSWVWPPGITLADVRWSGQGSDEAVRVLQRRYVDDGGVRITCGRDAELVQVSAIRRSAEGDEAAALPATVTVPARRSVVRWSVVRTGSRWLRNERWAVELTSDADLPSCTVALTGTPGVVLPIEHRAAAECYRGELDLRAGEPATVPIEPPRVARPYWLRLFVLDPPTARPEDPPMHQMRVT